MYKVKNQKVIKELSEGSLKASRVRNIVIVIAIMLTTILFTAVFTILQTRQNTMQEVSLRRKGNGAIGTYKMLSLEDAKKLSADTRIEKWGISKKIGSLVGEAFNKQIGTVNYMDSFSSEARFCIPTEGRLPSEENGMKEIACDRKVLECLGVDAKLGEKIKLTFNVTGVSTQEVTVEDTFTLCGIFDYNNYCNDAKALVSKNYLELLSKKFETVRDPGSHNNWNLDIMLVHNEDVQETMDSILSDAGYTENDAAIGVANPGYDRNRNDSELGVSQKIRIIGLLVIFLITGYLIINNIFQISVVNDIRFYGLLKTIGTTRKQIQKIIYRQAFHLSAIGIPLGLVCGYGIGNLLVPLYMRAYNDGETYRTISPWIFLFATIFSLFTVMLSCMRPGKMAGKVSPIEAVKYTDAALEQKMNRKASQKDAHHKSRKNLVWGMAISNLGRNKKRTVLVSLSMILSAVLFVGVWTYAQAFDMEKYISHFAQTDFVLSSSQYFKEEWGISSEDAEVPTYAVTEIKENSDITGNGYIYGSTCDYNFDDEYGMLLGYDDWNIDQLEIIDGDLSKLNDPSGKYIAAVYMVSDYGMLRENSNYAKVGDMVKVNCQKYEYYNMTTNEPCSPLVQTEEEAKNIGCNLVYEDGETYEVVATVCYPRSMNYGFLKGFTFIMNGTQFQELDPYAKKLAYFFNTTKESRTSTQEFLEYYTNHVDSSLNYESKQNFLKEFDDLRYNSTFIGISVCLIIGIIGMLNFMNAILTSVYTRKKELAILRSIGMTRKQIKHMLIYESMIYGVVTVVGSTIIAILSRSFVQNMVNTQAWYYTYHFTLVPILVVIPIVFILGYVVPILTFNKLSKDSVVELLRE